MIRKIRKAGFDYIGDDRALKAMFLVVTGIMPFGFFWSRMNGTADQYDAKADAAVARMFEASH